MAKKVFLFITAFIVFSFCVNAQTVLKKKEVSEKLDRIASLVRSKNYEKALSMFYSKKDIIKEENVSNKDLERYNKFKEILEEKDNEFMQKEIEIEEYLAAFYSSNYNDAFKLLSLHLDKKNSYKSTRDEFNKLSAQFQKAKHLCDSNKIKVSLWQEAVNNEEYEKAYDALEVVNSIESPFYRDDVEKLIKIQDVLMAKHKSYERIKRLTVTDPAQTLAKIEYDNINKAKASELLDMLNAHLADINSAPLRLSGKNPELAREINVTKIEIEEARYNLLEIVNSSQVSDVGVIEEIISNESLELSVSHINKYFTEISEADVIKLGNIYNLDVFNFFELAQYNTESKKNSYRSTPEYNEKIQELEEMKRETENTHYVLQLNGGSNYTMLTEGGIGGKYQVEYDTDKGGIYINLGAYNKIDGGIPHVFRNRFEFRSIPIEKFNAFNEHGILTEDDTFYRQMLFLGMSEDQAASLLQDIENVRVVALFQIESITKRNILKYGVKKEIYVASASIVRIVVYNSVSEELFFDKAY